MYDLKIEPRPDGLIKLTQGIGSGDEDVLALHPVQVRLLAEHAGVLPVGDIEARRTIARLCRWVRILADRIDRLDDMMLAIGEKGHEDVDQECAFSEASLELANEFLAELPDAANPTNFGSVSGGNPPNSGGIPVQPDLLEGR